MRSPRISLGSWAFCFGPFANHPWSFERFCEYTSQAGYDGVEINGFPPHPDPAKYDSAAKRRELKRFIEGLGLGISAYAPDFRSVPPAQAETQEYLELIRVYLAFCADLDIRILRVDTVTPPETLPAAEYRRLLDRLTHTWRRAAELCDASGITLVWEFEPGFWLNKPSEVLQVVRTVDHPRFRLLFDTSHAYLGAVRGARHTLEPELLPGGVVAYAAMLAPYVGHLHLIDSDGTLHDNETSTHAPFGKGFVPFPAVLKALRPTLDKLEWWCVDFCFWPDTESDAGKALPFVRDLAQTLAL